jgi:hypothetical protein
MLHVAKKMLDHRLGARLRFDHDDAAAQLRQQFEHLDAEPHVHADNPDPDASLRSGSVEWSRVHAGHYGRNSAYDTNGVFCPGSIQLQRNQHFQQYLAVGKLVCEQQLPLEQRPGFFHLRTG